MKELITSIFGIYEPVMTTQTYVVPGLEGSTLETVSVVAPGLAGVDWPYVAGVLLFAIVLYCFLRMVGGALK
ncbi:hypothetical protein SDC9_65418 [bioreactor metagenome]|uniref:Uncharacterized protein n=1 Tax=bioreactor metagenome TaxID=1076179 RepID=A0A644XRY3_9ZZZZ